MPHLSDSQAKYLATAPASVKGVLQHAFEGMASPRQAIKAKCLTCCNYERDEVAGCTVGICPLWPYRPFQSRALKGETANRAKNASVGAKTEMTLRVEV